MNDFENFFSKDELFILKKTGISFQEDQLILHKQGQNQNPLEIHKLIEIKKISIYKTDDRRFNWRSFFNLFNRNAIFFGTEEHASQIYALIIQFKSGTKQRMEIGDFDVITVSRILDKINHNLHNRKE